MKLKQLLLACTLLTALSILAQNGQQTRVTNHRDKLSLWLQQRLDNSAKQLTPNHRAENEDRLTTVFVRTSETLTEEMLLAYGGIIYAQLGDVSIITIPVSQIPLLLEEPNVLRIEANQCADITLDTVCKVANTLPIYEKTPQHSAFTGSGVIVGLMDVGFDLTHPTFYNNETRSDYRIKVFWDQLAKRDETSGGRLPVGRDFVTETDILAQGCAIDGKTQGHGTHTAGIAAGCGYDLPYRGVAYESDICLVANAVSSDMKYIDEQDKDLYTSATDALGFKYIFDYAEQQGKPCVVSFSEGYAPYMDEDDLLYNDFLERLIGPGRILVSSAGNESHQLTYLEKPIGKEQAGAFLKTSGQSAIYRIKSEHPATLTFMAYKDSSVPTHQLEITADDERWESTLIDTLFIDSDTLAIQIDCYPSAFDQQGIIALMQLHGNVAVNKMAPIALVISGREQQISVIGSSSYALSNLDIDPQWNDAVISHNILGPGCMTAPITVGSTTHRSNYQNHEGVWRTNVYSDEKEGLWSPFSSVGPTLDGRIKPDITAPGRNVISAYSSYYLAEHPTSTNSDVAYTDIDGRTYPWRVDSGTSMACPVAAGVIALWLQANTNLTREDIIGVLQRTSRHPEEDMDYPNNKYGYGEIDAYRGLLDILGITSIKEISQHEPHDARIWASNDLLHIVFDKVPTRPVSVTIYTTGGTRVYQSSINTKQSDVTLPLPTLSKGIYVVQLGEMGSSLIRK